MASPQVEAGHLRLANELAEQLYKRRFGERDQAVLRYIERHTYGYSRKACAYSTRAIADATGILQAKVRETIKRLNDARVIRIVDGLISIQKDYDLWTIPVRGEATRIGSETTRVGTDQVGSEAIRNGAHRNGSPIRNGAQKGTESDRPARPESANGADVRTPKAKSNGGEDHDLPPSPPEEGPRFTAEDEAVLKEAAAGLLVGPRQLPAQIGIHLRNAERSGKISELVLDAYHAMPPAKLALWLRAAMAEAREKAQRRTALDRYAASVIASALTNKADLLNPNGAPPAAANVVAFPGAAAAPSAPAPYADKPWGWLWATNLRGTTCDREYVDRLAQRAHDKGDRTCSPAQAAALFKSGGVAAAMDYVWAHDPRNEARNDAAV